MTPHIGKFRNGCASGSERGPEISSLAAVDAERNTAMHLECVQTPAVMKDGETRTDFYLRQVTDHKERIRELTRYIVFDCAYAKKKFADGVTQNTDIHLISKLGKDADLRYLYSGPRKGGKGRPKTCDGKADCADIDKSRFVLCYEDEEPQYVRLLSAVSL